MQGLRLAAKKLQLFFWRRERVLIYTENLKSQNLKFWIWKCGDKIWQVVKNNQVNLISKKKFYWEKLNNKTKIVFLKKTLITQHQKQRLYASHYVDFSLQNTINKPKTRFKTLEHMQGKKTWFWEKIAFYLEEKCIIHVLKKNILMNI
jgi:hypothetical protein